MPTEIEKKQPGPQAITRVMKAFIDVKQGFDRLAFEIEFLRDQCETWTPAKKLTAATLSANIAAATLNQQLLLLAITVAAEGL